MAQFVIDGGTATTPGPNPINSNTNQIVGETAGYSKDEQDDPNKIQVSVLDKETPIVVLFGPQSGGKTMTLIRLTAYLKAHGYTVTPVTSFRPSHDTYYKQKCEEFDSMVSNPYAAGSTAVLSFMLAQVRYKGSPICQILEAPGEHYFSTRTPKSQFPAYINNIINSSNRKIWAIMLEPDCTSEVMTQQMRELYVNKIQKLKSKLTPRDRVVFVLNKVDETEFVISPGNIRTDLAIREVQLWYPGIFSQFMNQNPITKLFRPYNFDFIPFQTGDYSITKTNELSYERSHDAYPEKFWSIISKRIKG